MSKVLRVSIPEQVFEVSLYDEPEDLGYDELYDYYIHEVVTNPEYTYEIVEVKEE